MTGKKFFSRYLFSGRKISGLRYCNFKYSKPLLETKWRVRVQIGGLELTGSEKKVFSPKKILDTVEI